MRLHGNLLFVWIPVGSEIHVSEEEWPDFTQSFPRAVLCMTVLKAFEHSYGAELMQRTQQRKVSLFILSVSPNAVCNCGFIILRYFSCQETEDSAILLGSQHWRVYSCYAVMVIVRMFIIWKAELHTG